MPSMVAVTAAHAEFEFVWAPAMFGGGPLGSQMANVIGMKRFQQLSRLIQTIRGDAGVTQRALIPIKWPPCRIGDDHTNRHRVEQLMESSFAPMLEHFALLLAQLRGLAADHLFFFVELDEH